MRIIHAIHADTQVSGGTNPYLGDNPKRSGYTELVIASKREAFYIEGDLNHMLNFTRKMLSVLELQKEYFEASATEVEA